MVGIIINTLCAVHYYGGILSVPKAIASAFGTVQYHVEKSSPLGGTLSVLQKVLITLEGKTDDGPPDVLL